MSERQEIDILTDGNPDDEGVQRMDGSGCKGIRVRGTVRHQLGNQRDRSSRNKHLLVPALVKAEDRQWKQRQSLSEATSDRMRTSVCNMFVC